VVFDLATPELSDRTIDQTVADWQKQIVEAQPDPFDD
jgi:hypothetical protein